jgi:hypothetical protein
MYDNPMGIWLLVLAGQHYTIAILIMLALSIIPIQSAWSIWLEKTS